MNLSKKDIIVIGASLIGVGLSFYVLKKFVFSKEAHLKRVAKRDLRKWKGKKETDKSVSDDLVKYWSLAGKDFTEAQMQNPSFQSSYPWSSAYIGHLVDKAGFRNFTSRTTHSGYVVDSKKNRKNEVKKSYWAFKPSEGKEVKVGDILVKGRSGSRPSLDTINSGVISHGDIVVGIKNVDGQKFAITQGGNISNTVAQTKVLLTSKGKLSSNGVHFAHLKYIV